MTTELSNQTSKRETNGTMRAEHTRDGIAFVPRFDICDTVEELILYGDFPGVKSEDVDIRYENDQLVIQGRVAARQEGKKCLYAEYGVGDFTRSFKVGESIDVSKISAEMYDGVLTIHLPKNEKVKPRQIKVKGK